jgi:excisionase family DNA binding protein
MEEGNIKPITVTVNTALRLTNLGRTTVYKLIGQGKIKTITIGRRRLVVYSSLEELAHAPN